MSEPRSLKELYEMQSAESGLTVDQCIAANPFNQIMAARMELAGHGLYTPYDTPLETLLRLVAESPLVVAARMDLVPEPDIIGDWL